MTVGCCAHALPTTLYATLTGCIAASYALQWDGSTYWGTTTQYSGNVLTIRVNCGSDGKFHLNVVCGPDSYAAQAASATCNPLSLTFPALGPFNTCCSGGNLAATVTT